MQQQEASSGKQKSVKINPNPKVDAGDTMIYRAGMCAGGRKVNFSWTQNGICSVSKVNLCCLWFFFFFLEHYLINCVIIRLLMRRQNATWTSGQPAGNVTISLRWHQTSVRANAKLSHYKPSRLFISERNTNNCLIVIGLLQVAHAVRVATVWIMKTHYGVLLKSVHKLLPK